MANILGIMLTAEGFDDACIEAIQYYGEDIKSLLDRYTLRDTGDLIRSGVLINNDNGITVEYGVDYFEYVFHRDIDNVTTPGTTSYWDQAAAQSAEFARLVKLMEDRAIKIINNKR